MSSKNHSFTMSHNGDNDMNNEEREKKKVFVKEDNLRMLDEGVTEGNHFHYYNYCILISYCPSTFIKIFELIAAHSKNFNHQRKCRGGE